MGYVAAAAGGVALGIGFLIWGLLERRARYRAEKEVLKKEAERAAFERLADHQRQVAFSWSEKNKQLQQQIDVLHLEIGKARQRLVQLGDKEAVRSWLTEELSDDSV